jgi:fructokinase
LYHGYAALGIGSFGPLDLDPVSPAFGEITSTPKAGWSGAKVLSRLRSAAGVPARIDTDVNGAALAEMRWGAGRGVKDFAYVTVGTGVGVGLIVNGSPTRGFGHCELGHIRPVRLVGDDWGGACPFHGACVEGLASGPAIKARVGSRAVLPLAPTDPVWEGVSSAIAQLCHAIVCAAAPRTIVIGGGVVENNPHLLERIELMLVASLAGYVQLPSRAPYIRAPELAAEAGPLGAIALAMAARH